MLNGVKDTDKWKLSTNENYVEDIMKKAIEDLEFEHPARSFILDASDALWLLYFSPQELQEIRRTNRKELKSFLSDLGNYMDEFEELKDASSIEEHAMSETLEKRYFDKRWVERSIIIAFDVYDDQKALNMSNFSEVDMLHQV